MEVIRNYPNQVFAQWSDYHAFHRALLREDVRFLREDFTGDVNQMCLALQQYVDAFRVREMAHDPLRDFLESLADTGIDVGDMDNEIITSEQEETLEVLRSEVIRCFLQQRVKRTELLNLMYTNPRDEDEDDNIYGYGVDEDNNDNM